MLTKEQIEERRSGIGGSDAAAVIGLDPYRQPLDVWLSKVRGEDADLGSVESVRWGNLLEDTVAKEWAERTGNQVRRVNTMMRNPDAPFAIANIDRRIVGMRAGLEIKTRGTWAAADYGPSGSDQVKTTDMLQCQHYMAVTGWERWHMAVLIGGQELRHYVIPRDAGMISNLLDAEAGFWQWVLKREMPPAIPGHESTAGLLKRLFPGTSGKTIVLDEQAVALKGDMDVTAAAIKEYTADAKRYREQLLAMIGDASVALLPDGTGGWTRKLVQRKGYTVEPTEYWDVRFSTKAGGR